MKKPSMHFQITMFLLVGAILAFLYVNRSRFTIVGQMSFPVSTGTTVGSYKGYSVKSTDELQTALQKYNIRIDQLGALESKIDFKKGFVFVSENSQLGKLYYGLDSLGFAALRHVKESSVGVSVVLGPKDRGLKCIEYYGNDP